MAAKTPRADEAVPLDRTPGRRSYESPRLTEYGKVRDLTTGGTSGDKEGKGNAPHRQKD